MVNIYILAHLLDVGRESHLNGLLIIGFGRWFFQVLRKYNMDHFEICYYLSNWFFNQILIYQLMQEMKCLFKLNTVLD